MWDLSSCFAESISEHNIVHILDRLSWASMPEPYEAALRQGLACCGSPALRIFEALLRLGVLKYAVKA